MGEFTKSILNLEFIPCHRKKERSPIINNIQFPLCYRCTFILVGYLFVFALFVFNLNFPIILGFIFSIPMLIDGITQVKKLRHSTNFLRSTTGFLAGFGQAIIIKNSVVFVIQILS